MCFSRFLILTCFDASAKAIFWKRYENWSIFSSGANAAFTTMILKLKIQHFLFLFSVVIFWRKNSWRYSHYPGVIVIMKNFSFVAEKNFLLTVEFCILKCYILSKGLNSLRLFDKIMPIFRLKVITVKHWLPLAGLFFHKILSCWWFWNNK